ncbi:MAG: tetratricopeptide repeat protein [Acidobacteriia bacterium]|nr:tetratricopeptide repeat protein [Terriglobia bacterium]
MPDQVLSLDSLIGVELSHYRIIEEIGSGGMGVVFRAHDEHLDREVAIKVLLPGTITDEWARKHLHKEALALSKLNHPNIATIFDFDTQGGIDFLVMEYIPGVTLNEKLAGGPLPENEVLRLGMQLSDGLAAAHEHGVVHRDLKPGNLRLASDGRLKILDFGLAKLRQPLAESAAAETTLQTQAISGTFAYMAPEQLMGEELDARTDIHGAGLVLYEMATGQRPFAEVQSGQLIGAILRRPPAKPRTLNPKLSPELERIIGKCLEKDPEDRYQSAKELAADLSRLGRDKRPVPTAGRAPIGRQLSSVRVNKKALFWAAGIAAVFLATAAVLAPLRQQLRTGLGLSPMPRAKQVAVLPFSVVGSDPETAAFSAGLTETLTAKLTQLTGDPSLQVVPATEIRAKHISTVDDARKEFGANLALEGSLHKSGEQIRVNYILVDAQTRRQIRASSLTVAATDPFGAQDAVVDGAIRMLEIKVQGRERQALESHGTQVARAYDYYLQGRGYLQNYDRVENLDSAVQVFERALALDPRYALAYAGLGDAYWKKYESSREPAWIERSREACQQANRLDSRLSSAHACLGSLYAGTGNYQEAAREFERAVENEPTNDAAFHGLADAYQHLGKPQDAEATYRRAIELRPHYWSNYSWLGAFFYRQARYREAAEMFNQVVALAPDSFLGYSNLGAAYVEQGRYTEAIAVLERSIAIRPIAYGYTNLGNAYFFLRRYEEADRAYEQAVKLSEKESFLWWNLGDGYYWTPGKRNQSVTAYRQAIAIAREELRVNPKDSYAYGVLAICHAMLGEKKPALDALRRELQLSPNNPFSLFQAALVYNQFDQPDEAIDWLRKALAAGYSPSRIRDLPNFDHLRTNPQFPELLRTQ